MATDPYASFATSPGSLGRVGAVITPSDQDLDPIPKGIVCLSGGDVTLVPMDNADADTLTFTAVTAGFVPPFRVRRVTAATATVAAILD